MAIAHAKWTHRSRLPARGSHRPHKVDTPPPHSHRPPGDGHTVSAKVASKRSSHRPLRSGHTTPVQREGVQPPPTLGGHTDPVQPSPTIGGDTVQNTHRIDVSSCRIFNRTNVQPTPTEVDTMHRQPKGEQPPPPKLGGHIPPFSPFFRFSFPKGGGHRPH